MPYSPPPGLVASLTARPISATGLPAWSLSPFTSLSSATSNAQLRIVRLARHGLSYVGWRQRAAAAAPGRFTGRRSTASPSSSRTGCLFFSDGHLHKTLDTLQI